MSQDYVGPPRLISHSCQAVDVDQPGRHCLLELEVENRASLKDGRTQKFNISLEPQTLDAVLGSMDRIKKQLSNLTTDEKD